MKYDGEICGELLIIISWEVNIRANLAELTSSKFLYDAYM